MDHYNKGRPFILAGHSQGSAHLLRLIQDYIDNNQSLRKQLVAVYALGLPEKTPYESVSLPVCQTAEATGCFIGWRTVAPDFLKQADLPTKGSCVNPLSWRLDEVYAGHHLHKGAFKSEPEVYVIPKAADAQCQNGWLVVPELRTNAFAFDIFLLGGDNYHMLDYHLFHNNLRENVEQRAQVFMKQHINR